MRIWNTLQVYSNTDKLQVCSSTDEPIYLGTENMFKLTIRYFPFQVSIFGDCWPADIIWDMYYILSPVPSCRWFIYGCLLWWHWQCIFWCRCFFLWRSYSVTRVIVLLLEIKIEQDTNILQYCIAKDLISVIEKFQTFFFISSKEYHISYIEIWCPPKHKIYVYIFDNWSCQSLITAKLIALKNVMNYW